MTRALHLTLVAILVCSLPVLGVGAGSVVGGPDRVDDRAAMIAPQAEQSSTVPVSEPDLNLSARLDLPTDEPVASGIGSTDIDVGAMVMADADRIESQYRAHLLSERLTSAESDTERRVVLRETLSEYDELILELRQREMNAARSYRDGEVSDRELLNELGSIQMRAIALEPAIAELDRYADETPGISLSAEAGILSAEIETLQGPVRQRIVTALEGNSPPVPVHVASGADGVVLAMMQEDRFVRESIRFDNWDPSGGPELENLTAAIQRTEALYPWAFADERGSRSYGEASAAAYRGSSEFVEGSIRVYLDRSTGNVYREYQTLEVDRIETREAANESGDGLQLRLDRTYPGGPAKISLLDPETGEPINGSVSVNGRFLGWTGSDGLFWTIAPRGSITVTATSGLSTVTVEYRSGANPPDSVESVGDRPTTDELA